MLDSNTELFERKEILGYFCLYSLYRRLIPRRIQPEEKILSYLWKLQKKIPSMVICQNLIWNLGTSSSNDILHMTLLC